MNRQVRQFRTCPAMLLLHQFDPQLIVEREPLDGVRCLVGVVAIHAVGPRGVRMSGMQVGASEANPNIRRQSVGVRKLTPSYGPSSSGRSRVGRESRKTSNVFQAGTGGVYSGRGAYAEYSTICIL